MYRLDPKPVRDPDDIITNERRFKSYLEKHGGERARKYFETLSDLVERTTQIMVPKRPLDERRRSHYDSDHSSDVRRGLKEFYAERKLTLNAIETIFKPGVSVDLLTPKGSDHLVGYTDALTDFLCEVHYTLYKDDQGFDRRGTHLVHESIEKYYDDKSNLLKKMQLVLKNSPS